MCDNSVSTLPHIQHVKVHGAFVMPTRQQHQQQLITLCNSSDSWKHEFSPASLILKSIRAERKIITKNSIILSLSVKQFFFGSWNCCGISCCQPYATNILCCTCPNILGRERHAHLLLLHASFMTKWQTESIKEKEIKQHAKHFNSSQVRVSSSQYMFYHHQHTLHRVSISLAANIPAKIQRCRTSRRPRPPTIHPLAEL